MVCQLLNLRKVKCILQYFSHVVCQPFCCGQAVEVFFILISGILLKLKLEIWTKMCKLASECKYHFVLLEITSFFSLKTCSFGAKLCWQMVPCLLFSFVKRFERFQKSFLTFVKLAVYMYRRYGRLKRVKWTTLALRYFAFLQISFVWLRSKVSINWRMKRKRFGYSHAVS